MTRIDLFLSLRPQTTARKPESSTERELSVLTH